MISGCWISLSHTHTHTHTHTLRCPFRPKSFQAFRSVPQTVMEGGWGRRRGSQIQMAAKHSLGQPAMLIVNLKPLASSHSHRNHHELTWTGLNLLLKMPFLEIFYFQHETHGSTSRIQKKKKTPSVAILLPHSFHLQISISVYTNIPT